MIPLQHKNEFKLTAEELEAAITPKTKNSCHAVSK